MKSPDNIFIDLKTLASLHDTAIVGKTVRIRKPAHFYMGAGSIIDDFTYISCRLRVGCYTHIGANGVIIGGDASVEIGNFVNIAPGVRLIAASNDFSGGGLVGPTIPQEYASTSIMETIRLEDHVLLGTNVVVLPGTHIPEGVSAGACAVLSTKTKLEPWTVYVGNPARPIKVRNKSAIVEAAERLKRDRAHEFD
jgi:acetyltransferase-like isoleucine patch superfamily enzyme